MPPLRKYNIFISHCWEYNDDYYRLTTWLNGQALFYWKDVSVPEESALPEDTRFEARLRKRLGSADILLVIVGMEIAYRYWIRWEIKWARIRGIPILGVMPNGGERVPKVVSNAKCPIVGWRRDSVVRGIRLLALNRNV